MIFVCENLKELNIHELTVTIESKKKHVREAEKFINETNLEIIELNKELREQVKFKNLNE